MILFKQKIVRLFFVIEIMICVMMYLFGTSGVQTLLTLQRENKELEAEIMQVHTEVVHLEDQIAEWNTYPFYKEKIAREQLQMAREKDEIYYIT